MLVPGATAVLRGGPGVGRGDSGQKTGPEFGSGPAKKTVVRNTLNTKSPKGRIKEGSHLPW